MKKLITGVFLISSLFLAGQALSGDVIEKCAECHGKDGNSKDGHVPNIAGFSEANLKDIMTEYKEGDRPGVKYKPKNGKETDMAEIAKKLSDSDIEKVARYFSGKTFKRNEQAFDAGKAAKGKKKFKKKCQKCHSEWGTVADDDSALLLGQWKPYLKKQFDMFVSKERGMPKKMKKKFKKLSIHDIENIIEFLASGKE